MNTAEAEDEDDDPGALAAVGCLRAISTILESVSRLPQLFVQVEPTLVPVMHRMLTSDGQGFAAKEDWWALHMLLSITLKGPCVCFRRQLSFLCTVVIASQTSGLAR